MDMEVLQTVMTLSINGTPAIRQLSGLSIFGWLMMGYFGG